MGRMLNYLLVPFYTSIFSTSEYGVINELYAYVAFFNILYLFGMETTYFRFANKKEYTEKQVFNSIQTIVVCISIVISISLYFFSNSIATVLKYPENAYLIRWLSAILFIDSFVAIPFARLRYQNKAKKYAFIKLASILLTIFLNIFFLVILKQSKEGDFFYSISQVVYNVNIGVGYVVLANLLGNAIFILLLFKEIKEWKIKFPTHFRVFFKYSTPIMIMGFAGMINETIDRTLIKFLIPEGMYSVSNQAIIGIYSASYKLSIFMSLGIQAFRYAAEPFFFSNSEKSDSKKLFATTMSWFVLIGCFIFLLISLNINLISELLLRSNEFRTGIHIVPILLLANLFLGIYYNLSIWFKISDKTKFGSFISIFGALITLIANIMLIPIIGYTGSAIATLLCYFSMALISYVLGQKFYPIPYQKMLITILITVSILLFLIMNSLNIMLINLTLPIAFLLFGFYLVNKVKKFKI